MSRRWVIIALRRRSFVRWQGSDRNSSVWCADNELPFLSADAACICHLLFPPSLSFRTLSEDLQRFLRLFRIIRACFLDFRLLSMHFARLGSVLCSVATLFPFLSVEHNRGNVFRIFLRFHPAFCPYFWQILSHFLRWYPKHSSYVSYFPSCILLTPPRRVLILQTSATSLEIVTPRTKRVIIPH